MDLKEGVEVATKTSKFLVEIKVFSKVEEVLIVVEAGIVVEIMQSTSLVKGVLLASNLFSAPQLSARRTSISVELTLEVSSGK